MAGEQVSKEQGAFHEPISGGLSGQFKPIKPGFTHLFKSNSLSSVFCAFCDKTMTSGFLGNRSLTFRLKKAD